MFRSSTSSSKPRRFSLRRAPVIAVGVVVAVEILLRLPGVAGALDEPDVYYQPGVQERLDAVAVVEVAHGRIDVLFVGSSVVRTNIRPHEFDQIVGGVGPPMVSFNGGLSGLTVDASRLYVERLWLDAVRPRILVQGVRYRDLVDAAAAEEFEPFGRSRRESLWLDGSPVAWVQAFLLNHSRLVQHAGLLTEFLVLPEAVFVDDVGFDIDDRGFNATTHRLSDLRADRSPDQIPGGGTAGLGYAEPLSAATRTWVCGGSRSGWLRCPPHFSRVSCSG